MIVDFNAYVGHWWPGWEMLDARPEAMRVRLQAAGIEAAFVALLESPWYRNHQAANERLAEIVAGQRDFFLPLACLDPTASYWPEDLERCVTGLGMAGVRLYPGYHHYPLDHQGVVALAQEMGRRKLPLFVTWIVEEDRFAHPAIREIEPKRAQLETLLTQAPETTVVVTMGMADQAATILSRKDLLPKRVFYDISRLDKNTLALDELVAQVGHAQLLPGTDAPFLYPEGALMNLAYRSFPDQVVEDILTRNYLASPPLSAAVARLT